VFVRGVSKKLREKEKVRAPRKKRGFSFSFLFFFCPFLLLFSFWVKVRIRCTEILGLSDFLALLLSCTHLLIVHFLRDCLGQ
jgi:hypothetical protein